MKIKSTGDANTLMEKMGFLDEDLKTPQHDEMTLWLYANVLDLLYGGKVNSRLWRPDYIDSVAKNTAADIISHIQQFRPNAAVLPTVDGAVNTLLSKIGEPEWQVKRVERTLEMPVLNNRTQYLVGYVDMSARFLHPESLGIQWASYHDLPNELRHSLGITELMSTITDSAKWIIQHVEKRWAFEVKSNIKSIGELMRQLNTYRQYLPTHQFCVVAPRNDALAALLSEQGIRFIAYETEQEQC